MEKDHIVEEIERLRKEKDMLILAHYYVDGEIQDLADYVGDSYELSRIAIENEARNIIFCGVHFMGESTKILNPDKRVFLLDMDAGCPMADKVNPGHIREMRENYDDLLVVSYINSSAETKVESDVCVTSSNAMKIMDRLEAENIYFIPDKNLGSYVKMQTEDKNIILHDGYCYVHDQIGLKEIEEAMERYPDAEILVHPESNSDIFKHADYIGGTSGIIRYANESDTREFIVATEKGILHKLEGENPDKKFYLTESHHTCKDMKKLTLEKLRDTLLNEENEILLDQELMDKARLPLERMMEYSI